MRSRRKSGAPSIVVLGGPNGAGKSTSAAGMLEPVFDIKVFVNADVIARGLAGADPERAALRAGREMLTQLRALASERESFAFESTLASRTSAPWLEALIGDGYDVHVVYVWLRSAELAVERVHQRASHGGHSVPDDTVRRRYSRSCANFVKLYMPLATSWMILDNSEKKPRLVAFQNATGTRVILAAEVWSSLHETARKTKEADELG